MRIVDERPLPQWTDVYIKPGRHLFDRGEHGTLLTTEGLVALHAIIAERTIQEKDPIEAGVRDLGLLSSAYDRSRHGPFPPDEPVDLALRVAMQLRGVTQEQGFRDGAKRTGLALISVTLRLNGHVLSATRDQAVTFLLQVAGGQLQIEEMARWIRMNSRKASLEPSKTT